MASRSENEPEEASNRMGQADGDESARAGAVLVALAEREGGAAQDDVSDSQMSFQEDGGTNTHSLP